MYAAPPTFVIENQQTITMLYFYEARVLNKTSITLHPEGAEEVSTLTLYAVLAVSPVIFCVKVVKAIGLALTNVHPDDELCVSTYTLVPLLVFDIPFHTTVTSSFVIHTLNGL